MFDGRCRADDAMGVFLCFRWRDDLRVVPYFRRDGAVREEQVRRESVLRSGVDAGTGAALPRESDDTEVVPPSSRWALPRPVRDGRPPCSNWRDDLRVVPCFRRDCAVCEEQVKRESVLRSSAESGQGGLCRENRTTRRSSLQVVDGRCRAGFAGDGCKMGGGFAARVGRHGGRPSMCSMGALLSATGWA